MANYLGFGMYHVNQYIPFDILPPYHTSVNTSDIF